MRASLYRTIDRASHLLISHTKSARIKHKRSEKPAEISFTSASPHNRYEHICIAVLHCLKGLATLAPICLVSREFEATHSHLLYLPPPLPNSLLLAVGNIIRSQSVDGHANGQRCLATS